MKAKVTYIRNGMFFDHLTFTRKRVMAEFLKVLKSMGATQIKIHYE